MIEPMEAILTNEWTSPHEAMPPAGREVLVKVERPLKSGNIEISYGGVLAWNGMYWIDYEKKTKVNDIIHKWYMFERDTKETQLYG